MTKSLIEKEIAILDEAISLQLRGLEVYVREAQERNDSLEHVAHQLHVATTQLGSYISQRMAFRKVLRSL